MGRKMGCIIHVIFCIQCIKTKVVPEFRRKSSTLGIKQNRDGAVDGHTASVVLDL